MWQRRCDGLLDIVLCDTCIEDKDEEYTAGNGRNWYILYCDVNHCALVRHRLHYPLPEEDGLDPNHLPDYADTKLYVKQV